MNHLRHLFQITILLVLVNGSVHSQNNDIERKIDSLFSNYNSSTPGVAIAVIKDGNVVFKKRVWVGES